MTKKGTDPESLMTVLRTGKIVVKECDISEKKDKSGLGFAPTAEKFKR